MLAAAAAAALRRRGAAVAAGALRPRSPALALVAPRLVAAAHAPVRASSTAATAAWRAGGGLRGFAGANAGKGGAGTGGLAGPRLPPRRPATTLATADSSSSLLPSTHLAAGIPAPTRARLAAWLALCAGWTASMILLGGVTRLTRSGLSMTDWKFTGERPPSSAAEWEAEFGKYKRSPEFRLINATMTLPEFQAIYWMEWAHRAWGRALGLVFAVPAAAFVAAGAVTPRLGRRLGLLLLLGGGQGLVGWWMVQSGLEEPDPASRRDPRVAPTRLAAHLVSAGTIFCILTWTAASLAWPVPAAATAAAAAAAALRRARAVAHPLAGLVALTATSGAFVAGLDAGRAYNTFPDMNGAWVPAEYGDGVREHGFLKACAFDTAVAQLHHRALAVTTWAVSLAAWTAARSPALPRGAAAALAAVPVVATAQAGLGIATLLTYVPPTLGSAHQAGALTLLTAALALIFATRRGGRGVAGVARAVAGAKKGAPAAAGPALAGA